MREAVILGRKEDADFGDCGDDCEVHKEECVCMDQVLKCFQQTEEVKFECVGSAAFKCRLRELYRSHYLNEEEEKGQSQRE
jgi:hypothetical protein